MSNYNSSTIIYMHACNGMVLLIIIVTWDNTIPTCNSEDSFA